MSSDCTVLHVDDDPDVLEVSSDWAGAHDGITWLTASDPVSGFDLLSTADVDCLVSDTFRIDDGEPFVTRATVTYPDLPVVLFTSMDHDALDPDIRDSGAQYVKKASADPFDTLFDRVRSLVDDSDRPLPAVDIAPRATTRATDSDEGAATEHWVPIGRYRPAEGDDLAAVIVSAVEAYTGRDASEFPPLYEAVDADAVAALCRHSSGRARGGVQVRFVYADHELAVTGRGLVLVRAEE